MPYFITDRHPDCEGFGVVKEDGELLTCYTGANAQDDAVDNMVAMSIAEELEPGGTYEGEFRAEPDELSVGDFVRWEASGGQAQGQIETIERDGEIAVPDSSFTITGTEDDPAALIRIYRPNEDEESENDWDATETLVGHKFSTLTKIDDLRSTREALGGDKFTTEEEAMARADEIGCSGTHSMDEDGQTIFMPCSSHSEYMEATGSDENYEMNEARQVDLTPPAYMRAAARRGVELYEQGLAGEGVTEQTVREAKAMSNGSVTADKWTRIGPWISRHMVDLEAEDNQPGGEGFPGPGAVAFYLWGARPTPQGAERVMEYAERIVERLEEENSGRASGEAMAKVETRTNRADFEIREVENGGMTFEGYAALFDSASEPLPFIERIAPGAFRGSLKQRNDIKLLWNHDTGLVLGSSRAGSLSLQEDSRGLKVRAELPNTTAGRDAAELLRRGDVDAMSFGFSVPRDGDSWNADGTERTLNQIRLHEVSIVAFPAYSATAGTTSVRGLDKVAKRAGVKDSDAVADALLKVEAGDSISVEEKSMISKIIDTLAPEDSAAEDFDGEAWLQLKKKKLQLLKANSND